MITDQTGLTVKGYNSGPLGGDQQIGAKIVEGVIDFVIFFSDPLTAQPHDPDVKALMRISQVYDIPMAVNKSTADFMITSCYMNRDYQHEVINFKTAYCRSGRNAVGVCLKHEIRPVRHAGLIFFCSFKLECFSLFGICCSLAIHLHLTAATVS